MGARNSLKGSPQLIKQSSLLRTLATCGACVYAASVFATEVAVFPLLITAMTSHVRGRDELVRVAIQLVSHVISATSAAVVVLLCANSLTAEQGGGHTAFLIGCLLLLSLQFTHFRHPPAMASGGAVLCGIDPAAVIVCVVITGSVLLAEPLILSFFSRRR